MATSNLPGRPPRAFRPPPGMPRRVRVWYALAATIVSAIAASVPMCPTLDRQGRPMWRVEVVHDGDTVTCVDETSRRRKIRLVGIDCPELEQPYGREARTALGRKLDGGRVRVEGTAHDQHGRLLGTLFVDDRNLNRELVAEGFAWVFDGFQPDPALLDAEAAARAARRGLWSDSHPQPPSAWRQEHPPHR